MAVTVADCVPVFLAHPSGAIALLHSGWRGTACRIVERAIDAVRSPRDAKHRVVRCTSVRAICGTCYEVSADVYRAAHRASVVDQPTPVDLRAVIADQARLRGVRRISVSASCTRCDNDRFFSHRAGDEGRQLGVMIAAL